MIEDECKVKDTKSDVKATDQVVTRHLSDTTDPDDHVKPVILDGKFPQKVEEKEDKYAGIWQRTHHYRYEMGEDAILGEKPSKIEFSKGIDVKNMRKKQSDYS